MHKVNFVFTKKFNVALTYNVKPEEDPAFKSHSQHAYSIDKDEYAEWDTYETIHAIRDALSIYNNVTLIEADDDCFVSFKELMPDIVFNISEGKNGISREAQIPAILDMLEIPYTGSDPLTLSTCLDKGRTKEILSYHNIPTPKFQVVDTIEQLTKFQLNFPVIYKPLQEGSSKGIFDSSIVDNISELNEKIELHLERYNQPVIIEEFLSGREFTVALLGNGKETLVLPVVEMRFDEFPKELKPIYSYEAKWIYDTPEKPLNIYNCPADVDKTLEEKIKSTVLKTYNILNCKDWSRIDVRLDSNGVPNIIEVNPLPGVLPNPDNNSCYPKAARTAGFDYATTINMVLLSAMKRYGMQ